jgi:hypothetical protein
MAKAMEVHEMAALKAGQKPPDQNGDVPNSNDRGNNHALKEKTKVKVTNNPPCVR